jgi:hypothetical protein
MLRQRPEVEMGSTRALRVRFALASRPGSKRYPQFSKEAFAQSLMERGIRYQHFPELGE